MSLLARVHLLVGKVAGCSMAGVPSSRSLHNNYMAPSSRLLHRRHDRRSVASLSLLPLALLPVGLLPLKLLSLVLLPLVSPLLCSRSVARSTVTHYRRWLHCRSFNCRSVHFLARTAAARATNALAACPGRSTVCSGPVGAVTVGLL